MTFSSDKTRLLYQQLPLVKQLEYEQFNDRLTERGQKLQIEEVIKIDPILEVVIRITDNLSDTVLINGEHISAD